MNVLTVISASHPDRRRGVRRGFRGGWAIAGLFALGEYGVYALQLIFFIAGLAVMATFLRAARRVEPFTTD